MNQTKFALAGVAVLFLAGFILAKCSPANAQEYQQFTCELDRVVDGDTIKVKCPWPDPVALQSLRIAGLDTPESFSGPKGAKCKKELQLGLIAKAWGKKQFEGQTKVTWFWRNDRGANGRDNSGRLLANVILPSGKDWAKEAVRTGIGAYYDPDVSKSFAKPDWCK